jgi:hypothetical protein
MIFLLMTQSPSSFPPYVTRYFEEQRKEQQQWTQIAQINHNLKGVQTSLKKSLLDGVTERADQIEECEDRVNALVSVSRDFHYQTLPKWKQYLYSIGRWRPPRWWCCYWCGYYRREIRET